ncbi:LysR family transcriptional regulator [Actinopolymorpha sp. B17G11]|uniref:LysR substrate-binding domain-containing protein n=1 Tax=Actinopolymorpha sp. B17G11 TaxID=3160861 RepID=UPI0032E445F7
MELRQLRYFVAVAEELHFGRAAQRMHVVQPAVSQQIARLEREFGLQLLDRTSRTVRLTDAGERLLSEARKVLAAADHAKAVASQLATAGTRFLRIGTSPGLAATLESALDALSRLAPGLRTELDCRPSHDQLAAVRRGELDLALVRAAPADPDLRTIELWQEQVYVAVPTSHPAAGQPAVRLEQLADLPLRLPEPGCDRLLGDLVLGACRRAGFEPRTGRPVSSVTNALVEIGSGVGEWTAIYADAERGSAPRKVAVLPIDPPLTAPVALVVPVTQTSTCVAALYEAFRPHAPAAAGLPEPNGQPEPTGLPEPVGAAVGSAQGAADG